MSFSNLITFWSLSSCLFISIQTFSVSISRHPDNHLVSSSFFFSNTIVTWHSLQILRFRSFWHSSVLGMFAVNAMKKKLTFPHVFSSFLFFLSLCPIELRPTVSFARVHCPRRRVSIDFYASNSTNTVTPSVLTIQALVSAIKGLEMSYIFFNA